MTNEPANNNLGLKCTEVALYLLVSLLSCWNTTDAVMSIQLMLVSKATAYLRNLSQQPPLSHCLKKYIENKNCNSCFNYVSLLYKCLLPHHKRSKFFSLHLKNGSMVEALTCLHASILTNGSLLFVWLIFTIRSLHLTVQLYGSFNASKWGYLFSYQSCLQNHHYSVYS